MCVLLYTLFGTNNKHILSQIQNLIKNFILYLILYNLL